jgi:hypothetical protein
MRASAVVNCQSAFACLSLRLNKAQQMRWSRRGVDLLLHVRCAVYNGVPFGWKWRVPMKKLILAAFTALSLTAAIAPLASAAPVSASGHSGPYDNTANSLGGRYVGGGGG